MRTRLLKSSAEILDGAIRLGRHAEPDIARAVERLERAKGQWMAA
jgi:hypothetical protein